MLAAMIVRVNRLAILILTTLLLLVSAGCNRCPENSGVDGTIDSGVFKGAFTLIDNPDTSKGGQLLNVYLNKSGLKEEDAGQLVNQLENPDLWTLKVNENVIVISQVFPELSNTMNDRLNMVIPLEVPKSNWKKDKENQVNLIFASSIGSFTGTATPTSLECFLKRLHNE